MPKSTKLQKGLLQIYTGNGKGKTTAAMGLAMRATARGYRVAFLQFLKAGHDAPAIKLIPRLTYHYFGLPHEQYGWLHKIKPKEKPSPEYLEHLSNIKQFIDKGWRQAVELINKGKHDIIILDELNLALYFELLPVKDVIKALKKRPAHVEVVITGRQAPKELLKIADLVSDINEVKHPYQKGILAREGIDY